MSHNFLKIIVLTFVFRKIIIPEMERFRLSFRSDVSISKATLEQLNHPPIHLSTLRAFPFQRLDETRVCPFVLVADRFLTNIPSRAYIFQTVASIGTPVFLRYATDAPRNENGNTGCWVFSGTGQYFATLSRNRSGGYCGFLKFRKLV